MIKFSPSYISLADLNAIYSVDITSDIAQKPTVSFVSFEPNSETTKFRQCDINTSKYIEVEDNNKENFDYKLRLKHNSKLGAELSGCVADYDNQLTAILVSLSKESNQNVGANERVLIPLFNELNHPLRNPTEVKGEIVSPLSTNISCNPTLVYVRNNVSCKVDVRNLSSYPIMSSVIAELNNNSIAVADKRLLMPDQEFSVQFPIDSNFYAAGSHEVKAIASYSSIYGEDTPYIMRDSAKFMYLPIVALLITVGLISLIFVILARRNKNKLTKFIKWLRRKLKQK